MQNRYHNYNRPLASFDENLRLLATRYSGRIAGYDRIEAMGGTTLRIYHDVTGFKHTNAAGVDQVPRSAAITKQGVVITEDGYIDVNVDLNGGNSKERIDLLVLTHSFLASPGGASANYSIIKGAVEMDHPQDGPSETNPLIQIPLGRIYIPAGAVSHTATRYEPLPPKLNSKEFIGFVKEDEFNVKDITSHYANGDFNRCIKPGMGFITSTTNRPSTASGNWFLVVMGKGLSITQLAQSVIDGKAYVRASVNRGSTWTPWVNLNNPDVEIAISDLADNVGDLNYLSNNYITDTESLTITAGKLDAAIKTVADNLSNLATDVNNLDTDLANLESFLLANYTNTTALTSLLSAKADKAKPAWTNLTLLTGFTGTAKYRITDRGELEFAADITVGPSAVTTHMSAITNPTSIPNGKSITKEAIYFDGGGVTREGAKVAIFATGGNLQFSTFFNTAPTNPQGRYIISVSFILDSYI